MLLHSLTHGKAADQALAWLLTYALHSTLLLGIAWAVSRRLRGRSLRLQETIWRCALAGALVTTSAQLAFVQLGHAPIAGRWTLATSAYPGRGGAQQVASEGTEPAAATAVARRAAVTESAKQAAVTAGPKPVAPGAGAKTAAPGASAEPAAAARATTAGAGREAQGLAEGGWLAAPPVRHGASAANRGLAETAPAADVAPQAAPVLRHGLAARADRAFAETASAGGVGRQVPQALPLEAGAAKVLLPAWLLGALALTLAFFRSHLTLRRRLRYRPQVVGGGVLARLAWLARASGISRKVRLTCTWRLSVPVALGARKAEVCVPPRALFQLDDEQQDALLAHELAHLARRDPLWLPLSSLVVNVLFFQPLNWLAQRRLRELSELLCDEWAVTHTGRPLSLAGCLAEVAGWSTGAPGRRGAACKAARLPVPGMAGRPSQLAHRIRRLLDGPAVSPIEGPALPRRDRAVLLAVVSAVLAAVILAAPGISAGSAPVGGFIAAGAATAGGRTAAPQAAEAGEKSAQVAVAASARPVAEPTVAAPAGVTAGPAVATSARAAAEPAMAASACAVAGSAINAHVPAVAGAVVAAAADPAAEKRVAPPAGVTGALAAMGAGGFVDSGYVDSGYVAATGALTAATPGDAGARQAAAASAPRPIAVAVFAQVMGRQAGGSASPEPAPLPGTSSASPAPVPAPTVRVAGTAPGAAPASSPDLRAESERLAEAAVRLKHLDALTTLSKEQIAAISAAAERISRQIDGKLRESLDRLTHQLEAGRAHHAELPPAELAELDRELAEMAAKLRPSQEDLARMDAELRKLAAEHPHPSTKELERFKRDLAHSLEHMPPAGLTKEEIDHLRTEMKHVVEESTAAARTFALSPAEREKIVADAHRLAEQLRPDQAQLDALRALRRDQQELTRQLAAQRAEIESMRREMLRETEALRDQARRISETRRLHPKRQSTPHPQASPAPHPAAPPAPPAATAPPPPPAFAAPSAPPRPEDSAAPPPPACR